MTSATAASSSLLGTATSALERGSRWWLKELRACMPASWQRLLLADASARLFVWRADDAVVGRLVAPTGMQDLQFGNSRFSRDECDRWLAELKLTREAVKVGIVLDEDLFFQRHVVLPRTEIENLDQVLVQEVVHRTPFAVNDIWHGATAAGEASGESLVKFDHWIIPSERVAAEMEALGLQPQDIAFVAARRHSGELLPVASLGADQHSIPAWVPRTFRTLGLALVVTVALGTIGLEWWSSGRASDLEAAVIDARRAVQGGQGAGASQRLLALKAEPGTLAIWEELSRRLPDTTFLTELRIAAGTISLSGLSSDAAHLVRILDGSRLFAGAALAGPIVPDAAEQKDRFRITLKLRNGGAGLGGRATERAGT